MGGSGGKSHAGGGGQSSYNVMDVASYQALRKQNALNFLDRVDADAVHRPMLDAIWDSLTYPQKYAIWQYTEGSGGFNRPLSGYDGNWSNYVGRDNVSWDTENKANALYGPFKQATGSSTIHYERAIVDLTNAIEKSSLPKDTYLVRGSDAAGLAGMVRDTMGYEKAMNLLHNGTEAQVNRAFVGQIVQSHAFVSTGIAKDSGFSGSIKYRIYAPKGTKGIYAEPQSAYGTTIGGQEFYTKGMGYYNVGMEAEIIVQRGTKFRITNIRATDPNLYVVDMEVVAQPVFKTGKEKSR